ncbi:MAG: (Fe-S)-binding protein [Rikenellaceae bacterium]
MSFFAPFTLPFIIGVAAMFITLIYKYSSWIKRLSRRDKKLILRGIPSFATIKAIGEVISEALLHRRIFRVNPVLGYMHASLAFGWFLLISVGWIETIAVLGFEMVPIQGHVFFRYFSSQMGFEEHHTFAFLMDLLLAVVLSGVALAYAKRLYSKAMGMKKTTRLMLGDRIALSSLWFIFPARLVAESLTCSIYGGGGFLTGTVGGWFAQLFPEEALPYLFQGAWWFYSICLGLFFVALPFSRYMHIFTEVPLIFLRQYRLRSKVKESSFDNFQIEACSRCGICIDPCQLQDVLGINDVQSVYFLRDRRQKRLELSVASNCLMCGRCQAKCPVGIDLDTLRLNSRNSMRNTPNERRFDYFKGVDRSMGEGRVGYFAGCMTLLTPRTLSAMEQIFSAVSEDVWWTDRSGGVCCGRPLKLSGESDSARKMERYNEELFRKHKITTLVTSCPICLKTFREDYNLSGIEVLHHTEYIDRMISQGRLKVERTANESFTYHDPCELGRGSGIYDEPRRIIEAVGELREASHNRENSLCCGSSLANTAINDTQQVKIATALTDEFAFTKADAIVTACPLCKKALVRTTEIEIKDISEIVAENIAK